MSTSSNYNKCIKTSIKRNEERSKIRESKIIIVSAAVEILGKKTK